MNRTLLIVNAAALTFFGLGNRAQAQTEPIGPITIVTGQPVDLFFTNQLEPAPNLKVLQFSGEAINNAGIDARLDMQFDYVDMNGVTQFVSLPNFPASIPAGGTPVPVDGVHILDFCPQEVSLHFDLIEGEAIDLSGDFGHHCVTIPEPTGCRLAVGAILGGFLMRRRCR